MSRQSLFQSDVNVLYQILSFNRLQVNEGVLYSQFNQSLMIHYFYGVSIKSLDLHLSVSYIMNKIKNSHVCPVSEGPKNRYNYTPSPH